MFESTLVSEVIFHQRCILHYYLIVGRAFKEPCVQLHFCKGVQMEHFGVSNVILKSEVGN